MNIVIVKPRSHPGTIRMERLIRCEPLELEYLYTVLREYDPCLVDGSIHRYNPARLARVQRPDIVLFTAYIIHIPIVLADAAVIKKLLPEVLIFVGGVHAEVCPEHFDAPAIDGVFFADHAAALKTVVDRIGNGAPFGHVPGLALRKDGQFIKNSMVSCDDPLPPPDRRLFRAAPHRFSYLYFSRCASVKTAYGCTGKCTFCFCRKMNGGAYTPRPVGEVVDEIASIDADTILLLDDSFLIDAQRLDAFADAVIGRGIRKSFIAYGTASFVAHHETVIIKLRQAGLRALIIGLEYIDDAALRKVGKNSNVNDNGKAIRILENSDIDLFALFMVSPQWTREEFRRLVRYIKSSSIRFATFSTETLFPGTDDYYRVNGTENRVQQWWRFDLLRVNGTPAYMSLVRYYLWLYYLYLLPAVHPATLLWMVKRCGIPKTVKIIAMSALTGLEFCVKLLIWR